LYDLSLTSTVPERFRDKFLMIKALCKSSVTLLEIMGTSVLRLRGVPFTRADGQAVFESCRLADGGEKDERRNDGDEGGGWQGPGALVVGRYMHGLEERNPCM